MGKYIRYIACDFDSKELVQKMNLPLNFIFDLFEMLMAQRKIEGFGIVKILIVFSDDNSVDLNCQNMIDVMQIKCFVDPKDIENMNSDDKKRFILDSILKCVEHLSNSMGWNISLFHEVYKEILSRDIKFEGQLGKTITSPNKKHKAGITFKYESKIEVYLNIDNETIINFAVFSASFLGFKQDIKKVEWMNDNTIIIRHSNHKDYWSYDLREGKLDFYFERAAKGDPHGQYDLGMMYLNGHIVLQSKEKAIFWFRKSAEQNYRRAITILSKIEE